MTGINKDALRFRYLILIGIILSSFSCTYESFELTCLDQILAHHNMREYKGEDINDWHVVLWKYQWRGEDYFDWSSHLVDKWLWPTDCNGNYLFSSQTDTLITHFINEATTIGIVGIR